ncbi:vacuolar fusion protein MON1 homolog A [Dipodomys spectabilis]|uniref:vacuolar fusion protein MON1 homolog A n=1 Tax=Dipodomys spectabilis TaxID=105255 RepID=UPI001C53E94E|nr:vacuolar fusion protein MON1 homolog A [Dipodomys spectabilis]XP_042522002.1 vacuolar fusion protein MON1 homolog A [Dipodomys spectabilis]XP_042522003.1 vacuolar fusion protein MON1 homolog A [Dipodomys spectabilis]XP_042522004.1 vacuolar fusion protein MON1 homolog A [Dipodomys spectabilis]
MASDLPRKRSSECPEGTLAPSDGHCVERAESPTPGLAQGTEPGAGQEGAMFVHARSYEDLTETEDGAASGDSPQEGAAGPPPLPTDMRQISQDFSELSTQLTGVARDLQEEMLPGSSEDWLEPPGAAGRQAVEPSKEGPTEGDEEEAPEAWRLHQKHVFVLSEAGKPVYSRYGSEEALSSTMGVMVALVSFLEADKNAIRSIHADGYKVVFVRRSPLVLVTVARTRQSAQELAQELLYIYYQILSLLTGAQLNHIFQQKQNYDLRRLLSGSERITDNLLQLMARDPSFLMGAARCLPLAAAVRDAVSASLQQARARSLVFSILLARNQLVALVRRKDQFLHPIDLHLLFNLISSSSSFREGEAWTPVCLPKFNSAGFFHAHISYLEPDTDLCLLLVSTDREDFFAVSDCRRRFLERLRKRGAHLALREALRTPYYSVAQVGIPDLRHFLYKSKSSGLFTSPEIEAPYTSEEEQERLLGLYQYLHSRAHNASRPLKTIYYTGPNENLLAWVTGAFELYICYSPLGTKASAVNAIHKLMRWIRKEEDRLFILTPLTY